MCEALWIQEAGEALRYCALRCGDHGAVWRGEARLGVSRLFGRIVRVHQSIDDAVASALSSSAE